jgi:oxygen-independent coproporphyrinogen-3 oxidase
MSLIKFLKAIIEFEHDGLVTVIENMVQVLPAGRGFIRNICAAFDDYLRNSKSDMPLFSKAI